MRFGRSEPAATAIAGVADRANCRPGLKISSGDSVAVFRVPDACYANCDHSTGTPVLGANDFVCFVNAFAAGWAYANCDGSNVPPVISANDPLCFENRLAGGCE